MLGVTAGRFWGRAPSAPSTTAAKESAPARGADRAARPTEPTPALTFYQDLTAPLTAPPPTKVAKPGRTEKSERIEKPEVAPKPERAAPPDASLPAPSPGAFTIQVGAYKAREPAEALRARLAAAGHDAYIVEADGPGAARFRVRVGAFATREAAREAAARLAAERSVPTFITTR